MSAHEVEVAWEDLGTEHVGRVVHIVMVDGKTEVWGTVSHIELHGWRKTLFLGDAHPFSQHASTPDRLFFLG